MLKINLGMSLLYLGYFESYNSNLRTQTSVSLLLQKPSIFNFIKIKYCKAIF